MLSEIGWALVIWVTLPLIPALLSLRMLSKNPGEGINKTKTTIFITALLWLWAWLVLGVVAYVLFKLVAKGTEFYMALAHVMAAGVYVTMIAAVVFHRKWKDWEGKWEKFKKEEGLG